MYVKDHYSDSSCSFNASIDNVQENCQSIIPYHSIQEKLTLTKPSHGKLHTSFVVLLRQSMSV